MSAGDGSLGMLLAMDDGRPRLEDPLSPDATREGQRPRENDPKHYYQPGGDPNDLAAQGWALIVPEGSVGDRLVEIVRPLVAKRAEDQGLSHDDVKVLRVSADPRLRTPDGAAEWSKVHYDDRKKAAEDVPLYQLILGDFDQVPLAIQQHQGLAGRVGRLHFDDASGYEAYIDKLLRLEKAPQKTPGRVVVHTAHDGSGALRAGHAGLIEPLLELMNAEQERGRSAAGSIAVGGGVPLDTDLNGFFERTEKGDAGVLFTMSHGLGGPRNGWKKEADRRARQGAMVFGGTDFVTGDDLAARPFMAGGVWFMFACYSAGTPDVSAYHHWLERLAALGKIKGGADVLASLKGDGAFVASLPKRVLANPDGPVAFVGHVDLAWSYSFQDGDDASRRRAGQFQRIVEPMLRTDRVGVAVSELTRAQAAAETELVGYYDEDARHNAATGDAGKRAFLWMQRNDLAGYVLLGDPAARLPVTPPARRGARPVVSAVPAVSAAPAPSAGVLPSGVDGAKLERAICELVVGERTAKALAASCGVDRDALERLAAIYRKAGRAALGLKD
jgi:hypothetical protein